MKTFLLLLSLAVAVRAGTCNPGPGACKACKDCSRCKYCNAVKPGTGCSVARKAAGEKPSPSRGSVIGARF